jgi:hypothetical protein
LAPCEQHCEAFEKLSLGQTQTFRSIADFLMRNGADADGLAR